MINKQLFPFTAIVEQKKVKQALCIAAINHKVGGLLIIGTKGTGKSTLVRGLADILTSRRLVNIPLNISEDMVFGSIDMEYAMRYGKKKFSDGILAKADNNIVYIDDINLFRADLLRGLLDASLSGYNHVEREGISYQHKCDYNLVGTMNPEEGILSPQLLDKFGLSVEMIVESNLENRVQIIRNVLDFEKDRLEFRKNMQEELDKLKQCLVKAKANLARIEISDSMLELTAVYCAKAHCEGHRAELFLIETAKAIAALADRLYILPQDIDDAAQFVLPHRMRQQNNNSVTDETDNNEEVETESETDQNTQADNDNQQEEPDCSQPETEEQGNDMEESSNGNNDDNNNEATVDNPFNNKENIADIDRRFSMLKMKVDCSADHKMKHGFGKRSLTKTNLKQGRYVRAEMPKTKASDLAFDATIRAAAPYQKIREKTDCALNIKSEDIRQKVRERRVGNTFIFVVDASGSMGAKMRMKAVKGTIFTLLNDAYQKRDQVGMIAFRRNSAEVILPVTRSVDLAQKCLQRLPTGGKTPLTEGLAVTLDLVNKLNRNSIDLEPIVILLTDGRTNRDISSNPVDTALKTAEKFCTCKVRSVVIDTETDFIKLGIAKKVAAAMQANYYHLKQLSESNVLNIVKNIPG